jgi:hypothetical protein
MAAALFLASCGSAVEEEITPTAEEVAELPTAQEIVDGVIESFDNIRTYQFDMDMTMDMASEVGGEALERTVTMDNSGTLDLENRQMGANLTMNVVAPGKDEEVMGVVMYIIDGMMYAMPEAPGEEPTWMKEKVPAEAWEMMEGTSGLEDYKGLLEAAQVEVLGSEKVKGVDCYVLQLTPNMAQLWQTAMQPGGAGRGEVLPAVPEEFLQEVVRSFSVKQWIAKDTYFLMKVEIDMAVESNPELMGYPDEEGEININLTISLLAYNYNQPVSLELPPEAKEAQTLAQQVEEAAEVEWANVQVAVHAMMVDNAIATLPNPVTIATNDMSAFPDTSVCGVDKIRGPTSTSLQDRPDERKLYVRGGDKDGYLLYQHDLVADSKSTDLVNYVAMQYTYGTYTVDSKGTVTQVTTGYE